MEKKAIGLMNVMKIEEISKFLNNIYKKYIYIIIETDILVIEE